MNNLLLSLVKSAQFFPKYLSSPAWIGHIPFAAWLIQISKPQTFVELGTHYGTSYFSFCQAIKEANLSCKCYAIDTWKGDEQAGFYGEEVFQKVSATNTKNFSEFSRLIRTSFDEANDLFDNGSINLLHIDGCHTYEAVKHDFAKWRSKLAPKAIVCFHDTVVMDRNFGIYKFWNELTQEYPYSMLFEQSNGLGVLSLEKECEDPAYTWLKPGTREQEIVLHFFTAMGRKQMEVFALNDQIKSLTEIVNVRDAQNQELNTRIKDQEDEVKRLQENVSELSTALADHRTHINALDQLQRDHLKHLQERDVQLSQRDAAITGLQAQIPFLHSQITEYMRQLSDLLVLKGTLNAKTEELERKSQIISRISEKLRHKSQEQKRLKGKIIYMQEKLWEQHAVITDLQRQAEALNGENSAINAELVRFKTRVMDIEPKLNSLQAKLIESQNSRTILEHNILALHASNSWRITKPLRQITTYLRKLKNYFFQRTGNGDPKQSVIAPTNKSNKNNLPKKVGNLVPDYGNGIGKYFKYDTPVQGLKRFFEYEWDKNTLERMRVRPHCIPPYIDYASFTSLSQPPRIGIHLHLYYVDMFQEFIDRFNTVPYNFDLFVSTNPNANTDVIARQLTTKLSRLNKVVVKNVPNRGRDIAPMILTFGKDLQQYDIIAHFQSKKSVENEALENWADCILDSLIGPTNGSGAKTAYILRLLVEDVDVVYPALPRFFPRGDIGDSGWGCNENHSRAILEQYSEISLDSYPKIDFVAGSMFWAKAKSLEKFLSLPLTWDDFPDEPIPVDGTLAHALERLILVFADKTRGDKVRIHENPDRIYVDHLRTAKLYYNNGSGFNEGHSIRPESSRKDVIIFTLPKQVRRLRSFRFDPANHPLTLSLDSVRFFGSNNEILPVKAIRSNVELINGGIYSFHNWDPWFEFDIECSDDIEIRRAQFECNIRPDDGYETPGDFTNPRAINSYIKQDAELAERYSKYFIFNEISINNSSVSIDNDKTKENSLIFFTSSSKTGLFSVFDSTKFSLILGDGKEWNQKVLDSVRVAPGHIDEKADSFENDECSARQSVAIHFQIYDLDQISEATERLKNIPIPFDLFLSLNTDSSSDELVRQIRTTLPNVNKVIVKISPNRSGALDSLVINFGKSLVSYDILANFHANRLWDESNLPLTHTEQMDILLGAYESTGWRIFEIIDLITKYKGLVFPESGPYTHREADNNGTNKDDQKSPDVFLDNIPPEFNPPGSMFWANVASVKGLLSLPMSWDNLSSAPGESRLTLSHAIGCANSSCGGNIRLHHRPFIRYLQSDVLYLVGLRGNTSRYRVNNISDGLNELGYTAVSLDYSHWDKLLNISSENAPKVLVLMRCLNLPVEIVEKVRILRDTGTKVVCDYDDLLFEPEIIDQSYALRKANITKEVALIYRENLLRADIGSATTAYLANRMEKAGIPTFVIPNSLNKIQISKASASTPPTRDDKCINIFYGGETNGHDKDFNQCAKALIKILREYPHVHLVVMGSLTLSNELQGMGSSIIRKHPVSWRRYADVLGEMDINLAPLENIPFNQGKSELKIFEAGVYGIPTVASPVESYATCIENGVNGLLASDDEEWYSALKLLIDNANYRRDLGRNARKKALTSFHYLESARMAVRAYGLE
ncbi:MAG: class I SAM-dependent methyltransferase [Planctomycetaceae bacterium]|nr:class I SAM-dependent methyltransferase [Planctomycetaceae bacterium]